MVEEERGGKLGAELVAQCPLQLRGTQRVNSRRHQRRVSSYLSAEHLRDASGNRCLHLVRIHLVTSTFTYVRRWHMKCLDHQSCDSRNRRMVEEERGRELGIELVAQCPLQLRGA